MLDALDPGKVRKSYLKWGTQDIENAVRRANRLYWSGEDTGLSDDLFDALVTRLRSIAPNSPVVDALGEIQGTGEQVKHRTPMLSLEKRRDWAAVEAWAAKNDHGDGFWVSPKVDGIACSLVYDDKGDLLYASTRGDGLTGENITQAILASRVVPTTEVLANVEIRGELYLPRSSWGDFENEFTCARNVVAGYVKLSNPQRDFPLRFFPYAVLQRGNECCALGGQITQAGLMMLLERASMFEFSHSNSEYSGLAGVVHADAIGKTLAHYDSIRETLPFDADGVVLRINNLDAYEEKGATAHHPKGAIAVKFSDETARTKVWSIEWDVSRTGTLTPVANFASVDLAGASLSQATLHNLGRFRELGLSHGDVVVVSRRGGVIPQIERVAERCDREPLFAAPHECPQCGSPLVEKYSGEVGQRFLQCPEYTWNCPGQAMKSLEHFAAALGMKGFGPAAVERLYDMGMLCCYSDFFRLKNRVLPKGKSYENLVAQVSAVSRVAPHSILTALGIENVGKTTALRLMRAFSFEDLFFLSPEDLAEVEGVGLTTAQSIATQCQSMFHEVESLLHHIEVTCWTQAKAPEGPLAGLQVCVTGTLPGMVRKEVDDLIRASGGSPSSSVTSSTDILVAATDTSSKAKKARQMQDKGSTIAILPPAEFLKRTKQ